MQRFTLFFFAMLLHSMVMAGEKDTTVTYPEPIHRNVIKWNPTTMILWSPRNFMLSYERILGPRQSVALSLGYLEFPKLFDDTIACLIAITDRQKQGINVALEYRFYLLKRNRRPTPDGLYIAPYASYYGYWFGNGIDILHTTIDSTGSLKGRFYCFNLGLELGYQFVFWKRFTLDLVLFGPSVSYYGGYLKVIGERDQNDLNELRQDIYNQLGDQYPLVRTFFNSTTFIQRGTLDLFSLGFRYAIQIGFHF